MAEEQPQGPPVIIVEFTDEGARLFSEVVDRLRESLISAASVEEGRFHPSSRLDISVEGTEPLRFELNALSILRIDESNRYVFPFPQGIQSGPVTDLEEAQAFQTAGRS